MFPGGQKIVAVPNAVDGFVDYVYKEVVPICFIVPLQASFDLNEGQTYLVREGSEGEEGVWERRENLKKERERRLLFLLCSVFR